MKSQDRIILLLSLAVIIICSLLILNPDYLANSDGEGQKIGSLQIDGSGVRKKISSEYFWQNITGINDLRYGDSIFTGSSSTVLVEFLDGGSLKLNENSLVKFQNKKNGLYLDLAFGRVQVDSNSKFITINDCGQAIQVEASSAKFNIDKGRECGDVQFNVESGTINVENKLVEANTKFNLATSNSESSLDKLIKLIERPRNLKAHIQRSKSGEFEFVANWDPVSKTQEYELEIDVDPEFKTDKKSYMVKVNSAILPVSDTKVYYRLRANESAEKLGEFSYTESAEFVENLTPPSIKKTKFDTQGMNKLSLRLNFTPSDYASLYRVEISDTSDFKVVKEQEVGEPNAKFLNLDRTAVYVRVRAESPHGKSEYSVPILASFKYNAEDSKDKVLSKKCMVNSFTEAGPAGDFNVDWKPVPMANDYRIKIVDQKKSVAVARFQSREPASSVTVPGCGEYDIQVEAYDKAGRKISSEFNATKIIYNPILALTKPIISVATKNMNIFVQKGVGRFVWLKWIAKKREGSYYKLEIASDQDFKTNYKQFAVKDNKILLRSEFQKGQYYWRVRQQNSEFFSEWSELGKVKVTVNEPDVKQAEVENTELKLTD